MKVRNGENNMKRYTDEQEVKIENEFSLYTNKLTTHDEFWGYVGTWLDEGFVTDIMKEWDLETKEAAIKDIKKIIKNRCKK